MFNYSSGMPLSIGAVYAIQDKFIELKLFMIAFAVWLGFYLFYFGHEVSFFGAIAVCVATGLCIMCVSKTKKEDSLYFPDNKINWLNIFNNGDLSFGIGGGTVVDSEYFQLKFDILPSSGIRNNFNYMKKLENIHLLSMDLKTKNEAINSDKYRFIYFSRRAFLLPHIYELAQSAGKRVANVNFVDKVKIDPETLRGKNFTTQGVRNGKNIAEYMKPPFLKNAGKITASDLGVSFVLGFKVVNIKYENIELYAYPNRIDSVVDYLLIFGEKSYMFKLVGKINMDLIPDYQNKYAKHFV